MNNVEIGLSIIALLLMCIVAGYGYIGFKFNKDLTTLLEGVNSEIDDIDRMTNYREKLSKIRDRE